MFAERMACPTEYGIVSAGSTWSAVTGPFGQLYMWGKPKLTGDTMMYPQVNLETMISAFLSVCALWLYELESCALSYKVKYTIDTAQPLFYHCSQSQ